MLIPEQNEHLTRVGPGTPMGSLMRRYWHLAAATAQLEANPIRAVKLLGESLVLYRDKQGRLGLLAEACAHRGVSLAYGMIENEGLRCSYHGWLYDAGGKCLQQPLEPGGGSPKDQMTTVAYPVQELAGLIFAYLGPGPVPLLPRYNVLVWDDVARETDGTMISCNWLQVMENLLDPMHVENLHGRYFAYVLERQGGDRLQEFLSSYAPAPMRKIGFDLFERGIIERHVVRTEEDYSWKTGTPTFFPTTSLVGSSGKTGSVIFVVPVDDTHTWFVQHVARRPSGPIPPQEANRFYDVPGLDPKGKFITDTANGQDHMAVVTQGGIARREVERLGMSDLGIVLYRELLMEQMERVERGHDPMNVYRNPTESRVIDASMLRKLPKRAPAAPSARQRKRMRRREENILQQSFSKGVEAAPAGDRLGRGPPPDRLALATGHHEVVMR